MMKSITIEFNAIIAVTVEVDDNVDGMAFALEHLNEDPDIVDMCEHIGASWACIDRGSARIAEEYTYDLAL
jgi:hypothetical protein